MSNIHILQVWLVSWLFWNYHCVCVDISIMNVTRSQVWPVNSTKNCCKHITTLQIYTIIYFRNYWGRRWLPAKWQRGLCVLQWRHNGRYGVSNRQHHNDLLNRLFRRRSKKTSKLDATGLCGGNSPVTGEFPAQMASNAENVCIWWRHHGLKFV